MSIIWKYFSQSCILFMNIFIQNDKCVLIQHGWCVRYFRKTYCLYYSRLNWKNIRLFLLINTLFHTWSNWSCSPPISSWWDKTEVDLEIFLKLGSRNWVNKEGDRTVKDGQVSCKKIKDPLRFGSKIVDICMEATENIWCSEK